jgi:hypothetical protein
MALGLSRRDVQLHRRQHAELVAVGVGHDDPAGVTLTDVEHGGAEAEQTIDLGLLVAVRSEVEVQPVLAELGIDRGTAPRDLRSAGGRLDGCFLVLVQTSGQPSAALQK